MQIITNMTKCLNCGSIKIKGDAVKDGTKCHCLDCDHEWHYKHPILRKVWKLMTPFSLWLQVYVEENNLSQAELCRRTGFDDATINKHFSGVQSPSRKKLAVYAKAFNLSIADMNEIAGLYEHQGEWITGRDKLARLYKSLSMVNKNKLILYADKLLTDQED